MGLRLRHRPAGHRSAATWMARTWLARRCTWRSRCTMAPVRTLHPVGRCSTYADYVDGNDPAGLDYWNQAEPHWTYYRRKHREHQVVASIDGPMQNVAPDRRTFDFIGAILASTDIAFVIATPDRTASSRRPRCCRSAPRAARRVTGGQHARTEHVPVHAADRCSAGHVQDRDEGAAHLPRPGHPERRRDLRPGRHDPADARDPRHRRLRELPHGRRQPREDEPRFTVDQRDVCTTCHVPLPFEPEGLDLRPASLHLTAQRPARCRLAEQCSLGATWTTTAFVSEPASLLALSCHKS